MRAAVITQYGNAPEVVDVERPAFPADSVMVEVHAASINPIDWIVMAGYVQQMLPYDLPWIVGYDVSGVVTEVGADVTAFAVGEEIFARADSMQAGTMAEYAAIKASDLAIKPEGLSHAEAAGVPLVGLTAWQALFDHGGLQEGQRVLIHAGSGGVGTLAIQIAKHAGAWVATTASARNEGLVRDLGADQVVDYANERFEDVVEPVDLVIDMLGDETLARSFDVVKPGGTVVSIKGEAPDGLADERGVAFHAFYMQPDGEQLTDLADLIRKGVVRPILDRTFPLEDVAAAYAHAQSGKGAGKVAVTVR